MKLAKFAFGLAIMTGIAVTAYILGKDRGYAEGRRACEEEDYLTEDDFLCSEDCED